MRVLRPNVKDSFAYKTFTTRIPSILGKIVDYAARKYSAERNPTFRQIISDVGQLLYQLTRNKQFPTKEVGWECEQDTWFDAPWLFSECYLYHYLNQIVGDFDVFQEQKLSSFTSSIDSINEISRNLDIITLRDAILFSLWGNQADLSLNFNTDATRLQSSMQHLEIKNSHIIVNHLELLVKHLEQSKIICIVLDNAGFELFTDLILADYLTCKHDISIIFEGKQHPWFVSDTTSKDFWFLLENVGDLSLKWKTYMDTGKWKFQANPFWTSHHPFSRMQDQASNLYNFIKKVDLVIFKGDLNYRKMVHDADWPKETLFEEAIGSLAHDGFNFAMLRTCKANTVAGVDPNLHQSLTLQDPDWMVNGKYGIIQYHVPISRRE